MFEAARVFKQRDSKTGLTEWWFSAREGTFGPFTNMQTAAKALDAYIQNCLENNADGGRNKNAQSEKLTLEPMTDFLPRRKR